MADIPQRILILRLSAAGDVVHALPTARAIKKANPGAFLAWLVEDRFADIVRACPEVDQAIIVPRRAWKGWSAWQRLAKAREILAEIKGLRFDAALDLQGLTKSAIAPWLASIPLRVGFAGGDGRCGRELSPWLNNFLVKPVPGKHVVELNLSLLSGLGLSAELDANGDFAPGGQPLFPVPEEPREVRAFRESNRLAERGFIALHFGAGWPAKKWPAECWAELIKSLKESLELPILISWGGKAEFTEAERIVDSSGKCCIMAPDLPLAPLWALLAKARLFVSADTGPLHLAVAGKVPSVALFGPTDGLRNGPYPPPAESGGGIRHKVVAGRCPNHPRCWSKRHRDACTCMQRIGVAEVMAACKALLASNY